MSFYECSLLISSCAHTLSTFTVSHSFRIEKLSSNLYTYDVFVSAKLRQRTRVLMSEQEYLYSFSLKDSFYSWWWNACCTQFRYWLLSFTLRLIISKIGKNKSKCLKKIKRTLKLLHHIAQLHQTRDKKLIKSEDKLVV